MLGLRFAHGRARSARLYVPAVRAWGGVELVHNAHVEVQRALCARCSVGDDSARCLRDVLRKKSAGWTASGKTRREKENETY